MQMATPVQKQRNVNGSVMDHLGDVIRRESNEVDMTRIYQDRLDNPPRT